MIDDSGDDGGGGVVSGIVVDDDVDIDNETKKFSEIKLCVLLKITIIIVIIK